MNSSQELKQAIEDFRDLVVEYQVAQQEKMPITSVDMQLRKIEELYGVIFNEST